MTQISRSLIASMKSEDALDALINTHQEEVVRDLVKCKNAREERRKLHLVKRKHALLSNTIAPGVDVMRYLGVELKGASMRQYPLR